MRNVELFYQLVMARRAGHFDDNKSFKPSMPFSALPHFKQLIWRRAASIATRPKTTLYSRKYGIRRNGLYWSSPAFVGNPTEVKADELYFS